MSETNLPLLKRLALALLTFWRILVDPEFAARVAGLSTRDHDIPAPEPPRLIEAEPDAALQLLGLLQQEGRLVDFLQEDVAGYSDAEVGAAARVVHEGCSKALAQHLTIEAVRAESEGARVTLSEGFDSSAVRVTGRVVGEPPFSGSLTHRGWRVTETRLPKLSAGHDSAIIAPAEVEL
jgi:hypothetical protein